MAKDSSTSPLREFHDLGKEVLAFDDENATFRNNKWVRAWGKFSELIEITGKSRDELCAARRFASWYSQRELNEICQLGQRKGRPLTKEHIKTLLRVRDETTRKNLAEKCANGSWSVRRLMLEVRGHYKGREYGGREIHAPESWQDALVEIHDVSQRWIRWSTAIEASKPISRQMKRKRGDPRRALRRNLVDVKKRVEELLNKVADLM